MPKKIDRATNINIIKMYNSNNYSISEIANLNNVSACYIWKIINAEERKKKVKIVHKYRKRNGVYPSTYVKKGYHRKFTEDDKRQIAIDYYENGLSNSIVKEKWGVSNGTMQLIREQFRDIYGYKENAQKRFKEKGEKKNEKSEN